MKHAMHVPTITHGSMIRDYLSFAIATAIFNIIASWPRQKQPISESVQLCSVSEITHKYDHHGMNDHGMKLKCITNSQ